MFADPDVALSTIILSGLLSLCVMKDTHKNEHAAVKCPVQ